MIGWEFSILLHNQQMMMSLHAGQAELRRQLSQLSARIPSSSGIHLDDGASGAEDTVAKPNQRKRRRSETQSSDILM